METYHLSKFYNRGVYALRPLAHHRQRRVHLPHRSERRRPALTVANVVRLALYARRDELDIMNLGAPQAYVRGPFVMEGSCSGLALHDARGRGDGGGLSRRAGCGLESLRRLTES
jgi:hypothetical protein